MDANDQMGSPRFPQPGDSVDVFNAWHQYWVDINVAALRAGGYDATTQVYFSNSNHTANAILDIVASQGGVPQFGMEIKTQAFSPSIGIPNFDELYSDQQKIVYPQIRAGTAIPYGGNAAIAGFTTDRPLGYGLSIIDFVVYGRGMH